MALTGVAWGRAASAYGHHVASLPACNYGLWWRLHGPAGAFDGSSHARPLCHQSILSVSAETLLCHLGAWDGARGASADGSVHRACKP